MRTSSLLRLVVASLLLGGVWLAYTQAPPAQAMPLTTQKLAADLYVIKSSNAGNVTVMITDEGLVVVDDKFPVDQPNLMAEIRKFTNQPVKYVVNTHHHGDHSGGNVDMQKLGAQIVTSEQARQHMVDGKQPGLSNVAFENHMHIYLGGKNVELYYLGRAHTNGDIVALFPAQRVLAMGDMFTWGDAAPELVDYGGGGSAKEWTPTVNRALAMDFDTVVPGHGEVTNKAGLTQFRDQTLRLRDQVHAAMAAKKSRADIEKMLRGDFHFSDLHVNISLDGLMVELR
jgi:cyclase